MKMRLTRLLCMMLLPAIGMSARAKAQSVKPAPELRKLDYFVGTWKAEGVVKPGPLGPGGTFTGTNQVEWMQGGFFLVTHSDFIGVLGKGVETSYMGYDSKAGQYTYDSFNSLGEVDRAKGHVAGDTWTWLSETQLGAETMKARLTQKIVSPTSYTFRFEMSRDGKTWKTVLEGRDTKQLLIARSR